MPITDAPVRVVVNSPLLLGAVAATSCCCCCKRPAVAPERPRRGAALAIAAPTPLAAIRLARGACRRHEAGSVGRIHVVSPVWLL